MLKKLRRAVRSFERQFEKRGRRSPLKRHRSLSQKVSLIVPTYNVELYIDEFLASVTSQTTGLTNLEVIIVDDGSTDRSGEIAQAWARRYPNTIRYIRQENKGLSGARNTGLDHATGEWVSFPDPDDILDRKWLAAFDREIRKSHSLPVLMVTRPISFFRESTGRIHKTHPLNRLYTHRAVTPADFMGDYIVLSAAVNFFNRSAIERAGLRFDKRVRPSFEDGHFINLLISKSPDYTIIRLPKPSYIYRKRDAGTSLVDGARSNPLWYTDQLRYGYLDLFHRTKDDDGNVPHFVQRTVLYDIGYRFTHLLNHPDRASCLTANQLSEFVELLQDIFAYIDVETIRSMKLGPLHEEIKIGLLSMYKNEHRANDFVYLEQYDPRDGTFQFSSYTGGSDPLDVTIFVDGKPAEQIFPSRTVSMFLDRPFFSAHRFWIKASPSDELRATVGQRPARIRSKGKTLGDRVPVARAIASLRPADPRHRKLPDEARRIRAYSTSSEAHTRYDGCWVLMDRDDAADDNAEHLYRYLMKIGQAEKAFFILREDSPDWPRLEKEGFKLLPFGSDEHMAALINADILASSHADHFIFWPVEKSWMQDLVRHQFVFLQHGVIHNNLSRWLNPKPIRLFITAAENEYDSIATPESNYLFSPREAKLTGLPRHDALLSRPHAKDTILFMPTWRRYLLGDPVGLGTKRDPMPGFMQTGYAQAWKALLTSDQLRSLAITHDKKIVFCAHPNMAMHLDEFELPDYIECRDPRVPPSVQKSFAEAALMVTDYSSVAFESAYINRPIVYYQFDREEFFSGSHVHMQGYFDYRENGFGPVVETQDQALNAILKALEGNEDPMYAERRERFFAFRDGRCCERVYAAIREILPEEEPVVEARQIAAE